MPKSSTWVVKLGGAMMHSADLVRWLEACAAPGAVRCVVVLGGGRLADEVRALHARWAFEEAHAHELAIAAMAINAGVAAALAPGLASFSRNLPDGNGSVLWRPGGACEWLGVPASWSATSDTLALALGRVLHADAVYLVKSPPEAAFPSGDAAACAAAGFIDAYLPRLLADSAVPVSAVSREAVDAFAAARTAGAPVGRRLRAAVDASSP